jgi:hypothetical protein
MLVEINAMLETDSFATYHENRGTANGRVSNDDIRIIVFIDSE